MDIKKLAPWNWFQHEGEKSTLLPDKVSRFGSQPERSFNDPFQRLDAIDRIFDEAQGESRWALPALNHLLTPLAGSDMVKPYMNIGANDKEYTITVEVPGVREKDIALELSGNCLVIKGEKKQESEDRKKNYYRMECSYGSFRRTLTLPEDAVDEKIDATFKDGVLTISIPRKDRPSKESRKIQITER